MCVDVGETLAVFRFRQFGRCLSLLGSGAGACWVMQACKTALGLFRLSLLYFCPVSRVFGCLFCLLPTYVFRLSCQGLILEHCSYGARSVTQLGHFGFTLFLCQAVSRRVRYACGWFPSFVLRLGCQGLQLFFCCHGVGSVSKWQHGLTLALCQAVPSAL